MSRRALTYSSKTSATTIPTNTTTMSVKDSQSIAFPYLLAVGAPSEPAAAVTPDNETRAGHRLAPIDALSRSERR